MEVFRNFRFHSARHLPKLDENHICNNIHGHTFNLTVHIKGEIDQNTGLMTKDLNGILEPFIVGTEPYINNIIKLDSLSSINNNSISGTGSLLIQ